MKKSMFLIRNFLWHQMTARSRYQIHSPHLYQLLTKDLKAKQDQNLIRIYRKAQKKNPAGNSLISCKKAQVLAKLLVILKPYQSVVYGASSEMVSKLISEYAPQCQTLKIEQINSQNAIKKFEDKFEELKTIDFAFYDGGDNLDEVLNFFDNCSIKRADYTVLVFNSIYRSSAMKNAWTELIKQNKTMVSIDLFFFGLVIFKQGLSGQQIKYRY